MIRPIISVLLFLGVKLADLFPADPVDETVIEVLRRSKYMTLLIDGFRAKDVEIAVCVASLYRHRERVPVSNILDLLKAPPPLPPVQRHQAV